MRGRRIDFERKLLCYIKTNSKNYNGYITRKKAAKVIVEPPEKNMGELIIGNKEMQICSIDFYATVFIMEPG